MTDVRPFMIDAAEAAIAAVRGVPSGRLDGPTPCTEYDVRALAGHLADWTGRRARRAARKEPIEDAAGDDVPAIGGPGWAEAYAAEARATAEAWTEPTAWEGSTSLTGGGDMPAAFTGAIVFGEFVIHGWDLARSTGTSLELGDDLVRALYEQIAAMADQARRYKVFGPEVRVPESAPLLHRALGLAGRDPNWVP